MEIDQVLIRPILTEKATNLAKTQVYMFEVNKDASQFQIKTALEKLYKVKVGEIRIMIKKGKVRRVGRRMMTKKMPDHKIAYITVSEGRIDLFPQT